MDNSKYRFSFGFFQEMDIIWIEFPNDSTLKKDLKTMFPKARWSFSHSKWYIPDHAHHRAILGLEPKFPIGKKVLSAIKPDNLPAMKDLIDELTLKAYSPNTIRTYSIEFAHLLAMLKDVPVQQLTAERLRAYILYCIKNENISENHLHSRINALKFYFEQVLKRETLFFDIPRPKKPDKLPKALSKQEVIRIFNAIQNPKHLLMMMMCYGMGLRVSEIVNLRIQHIDFDRMQVLIEAAKGKKDRYVHLPYEVVELLKSYLQNLPPGEYLFP